MDQVFRVAQLGKMTGLHVRTVRRKAPEIPGHSIRGKCGHVFTNCPRLQVWIEENRKPTEVELKAQPPGVAGGEVLEAVRTFHDRLKAHLRRPGLTSNEKTELRCWGAAIAKLCR